MNLQDRPWGGGNAAMGSLARYLKQLDIRVSFDLNLEQPDIILLTDPRLYLASCAFNHYAIAKKLIFSPDSIVVHRINECDERKQTDSINKLLIKSNRCADHTIFVSSWLETLLVNQGLNCRSRSVILNGSDTRIFNNASYQPWDGSGPLRIITHHWGTHWLKGFEVYQRLDNLLDDPAFRTKYQFTYIGNLPEGFSFKNTKVIAPLNSIQLGEALPRHHVYLTASQFEPGSNHQNEGACCGLPLLYLASGGLPEYCLGHGVSFTVDTFEKKLEEIASNYRYWYKSMVNYPHTSDKMCKQYLDLFNTLVDNKQDLTKSRRLWRDPFFILRSIFS